MRQRSPLPLHTPQAWRHTRALEDEIAGQISVLCSAKHLDLGHHGTSKSGISEDPAFFLALGSIIVFMRASREASAFSLSSSTSGEGGGSFSTGGGGGCDGPAGLGGTGAGGGRPEAEEEEEGDRSRRRRGVERPHRLERVMLPRSSLARCIHTLFADR